MPQISAFHGLRYNLGRVGALGDVVAPPYDVINPSQQEALYQQHDANVIRLILNREQPGDGPLAKYSRAAGYLKDWLADGILQPEGSAALYVYHQTFQWQGMEYTRHGFMCRVRLERFGEGNIYPHEQTHPKAKVDRLHLLEATKTNLSPVFGLFPDAQNQAQRLLDTVVAGVAGLQCQDEQGVQHTLWPVSDVQVITDVAGCLSESPVFVADGHHRYETACNYRDNLTQALGALPDDHPANFVMMSLVSMNDPGLLVLPTHRLIRGTPNLNTEELMERLGDHFLCEVVAEGANGAEIAWERMEDDRDQGLLALYVKQSDQWLLCQSSEIAEARMRELEPTKSEAWRSLGVSLLHRLIIDDLLGAAGHPKPTYVHEIPEVTAALEGRGQRSEEESGDEYSIAALVQPATLEHVQEISHCGERMPAKSTYFYPKLLSGLVLNPVS